MLSNHNLIRYTGVEPAVTGPWDSCVLGFDSSQRCQFIENELFKQCDVHDNALGKGDSLILSLSVLHAGLNSSYFKI